jgi:hypothetical protein
VRTVPFVVTSRRRILTAAVAAPAALLAAAAPAHAAPQIEQPKPCYVSVDPHEREYLKIVATGFTPDATVDIAVDGVTKQGVANHFGVVDLRHTAAPYRARGQAPFSVTVREVANPANTVSATSYVTALAVHLHPKRAATSDRVRFRGRGFTATRAVWGHYVLRGHVRKTVRLARRPGSPCGTFSVRRRQIPLRHPATGRWTLQVDQQRHWRAHPRSVVVRIALTVERMIGLP